MNALDPAAIDPPIDAPQPGIKSAVATNLFRAASLIALVTLLSKFLGLFRDQMIAHGYGASAISDAYLYAFQIPSFAIVLLGGLGGPFHTATVAVLSKLVHADQPPTAQALRVTNTYITLIGLLGIIASGLAFCFAPQIIGCIAQNAPAALKATAALHLRIMSPLIFIGVIIGIFYGVANVYNRFFWPSFSPSALNITLILWLLFFKADPMGYALAVSTLLGGILQLVMQVPDFFKTGFRYFPAFDIKDPDFRRMTTLLIPATVGTTIGQLNVYVAMFFVSQLPPGGWTATMYGNRLIQFPIGILLTAMLVPMFPMFSRWVHEQDFDSLRDKFRDSILSLWLISFLVMALIFLLGEQGASLLFQHGKFNQHNSQQVSLVLAVLAFSMVPYMLRDGITRIFYAFNDSATPLIAGILSIGINFFFNWILIKPFGIAGVAFAQVIVTIWNAALLSFLIRRHIKDMGLRKLFVPACKMILAAAVAYLLGYGLINLLYHAYTMIHLHLLHLINLLTILIVSVAVSVIYLGLLFFLKVDLAQRLLQRYTKKWLPKL